MTRNSTKTSGQPVAGSSNADTAIRIVPVCNSPDASVCAELRSDLPSPLP